MYRVYRIVDGFPAKSISHGGFGWSSVHLLRGHGRVILVETGPPSYVPLLTTALDRLGLSSEDVTDVLLTHAHWDHLGNIMMFPRARVWIGAKELAWARTLPRDAPFVSGLHVREIHARGSSASLISDGDAILPGIEVLASPGHTPGHLAFAVDTEAGPPLIFAGDAVKNRHELATSSVDSTLDREASAASIHRLRTRMGETGALLVPGHDTPLRLWGGLVARVRPQGAHIGFFATSDGEEDRSINDGHLDLLPEDPVLSRTPWSPNAMERGH